MATLDEVKIENLTDWMRSLRLNSGTVMHLPPRGTSPAIASVEVQSNAEVEKLSQRRAIAVHAIPTPATKGKKGTSAQSSPGDGSEEKQKADAPKVSGKKTASD